MQVTLSTSHLRAASYFSASKDVRHYLKGVFVEAREHETRIVATDGNCAAILRDVVLVGQDTLPDVIIPNDTVDLVLSMKRPTVDLSFGDGKWQINGLSFAPQDGLFPPYRRIIPTQVSGEAAQFQPEFLTRFAKAAKALNSKACPVVRHNGEGGAQVQIPGLEDEFVGVLMPIRVFNEKCPDPGLSTWGPV